MSTLYTALTIAGIVLVVSWIGTWGVIQALRALQVMDAVTERSSHTRPTPRGGGVAVILAAAGGWIAITELATFPPVWANAAWGVLVGAAVLAAVSLADDVRGLPIWVRLATQGLVVVTCTYLTPWDFTFLVPESLIQAAVVPLVWPLLLLDRLLIVLAWLWFLNLYNFMDGIDGITGVQSAHLGISLFILSLFAAAPPAVGGWGLVLAAAALGFLYWNWHPARVFIGDVGAIPLGFLFAWLLLITELQGFSAVALILPLYYLADATITLCRRALWGETVWQAHNEHFYQRAVRGGQGHGNVARYVISINIGLFGLALSTNRLPDWLSALLAAVLVVSLLVGFELALRRSRTSRLVRRAREEAERDAGANRPARLPWKKLHRTRRRKRA